MSAGNDWFDISYSEETTMTTDEMGQGEEIVTLVQCAKLMTELGYVDCVAKRQQLVHCGRCNC
jgi:hypothetical protein